MLCIISFTQHAEETKYSISVLPNPLDKSFEVSEHFEESINVDMVKFVFPFPFQLNYFR